MMLRSLIGHSGGMLNQQFLKRSLIRSVYDLNLGSHYLFDPAIVLKLPDSRRYYVSCSPNLVLFFVG